MRKAAFLLVVVCAVIVHLGAAAQEEKSVKLGKLKLTVESVELKTGLEVVLGEDKERRGFPRFDPRLLGEEVDSSSLSYVDWLSYAEKYFVLKFTLSNEGEGEPLYVSSTVRYDGVLKAMADGKTILKQARIYPDSRPDFCPNPGVVRIAKGKKVQDLLIIKAPAKGAKKIEVDVFVKTVLPDIGGTLKIEIPAADGKPGELGKLTLKYEPKKTQGKKKKFKAKGRVKFGRIQIDVLSVAEKNLNFYDEEAKMVYTGMEPRTVVTYKVKNSGSKPVKFMPVLLQEKLPGIAVDHQGKWCPMVGIGGKTKVVECFDLKKSIPAKGEITDYVVLNPPAGPESIRLVLIAEAIFPDMKSGSGIVIMRIKYKNNVPAEVKSSVMKRSITLNDKTLVGILEESGKASEEAWDKKYSGLLVNGAGTVLDVQYDDEDNISAVIIHVSENAVSQTRYRYTLFMSTDMRSYRPNDKISFKAIVLGSNVSKEDDLTERSLVVYGVQHAKGR